MLPKGDTKGKPTGSTNQYHHYIPRFILRRYQVGPARYVPVGHNLHGGLMHYQIKG